MKAIFTALIALTTLFVLGCTDSKINSASDSSLESNSGANPIAETASGELISIAEILGVLAPVKGETPVTRITETAQYTGIVDWSPSIPTTFWSGTSYTATITLTAKSGYTLNGVSMDYFVVSNAASSTNLANSGVVTAVFPATQVNLAKVTDYIGTAVGTLKAVQGGTFKYGSVNMTVSSFRMSQFEVTGKQYEAITQTGDPSFFNNIDNSPVELVTWYDAVEFCNKLSILEGLTPVYTMSGRKPAAGHPISSALVTADWNANGYRLPTEAEWLFAAFGGKHSNDYSYAGSSDIDLVAWYVDNSGGTTHTVGTKKANKLGLYDMCGNVWEWCWDWYNGFPDTDQTDYRGRPSGTGRVLHGGSWSVDASECSIDFEAYALPFFQRNGVGFRVVRP